MHNLICRHRYPILGGATLLAFFAVMLAGMIEGQLKYALLMAISAAMGWLANELLAHAEPVEAQAKPRKFRITNVKVDPERGLVPVASKK